MPWSDFNAVQPRVVLIILFSSSLCVLIALVPHTHTHSRYSRHARAPLLTVPRTIGTTGYSHFFKERPDLCTPVAYVFCFLPLHRCIHHVLAFLKILFDNFSFETVCGFFMCSSLLLVVSSVLACGLRPVFFFLPLLSVFFSIGVFFFYCWYIFFFLLLFFLSSYFLLP